MISYELDKKFTEYRRARKKLRRKVYVKRHDKADSIPKAAFLLLQAGLKKKDFERQE